MKEYLLVAYLYWVLGSRKCKKSLHIRSASERQWRETSVKSARYKVVQ